MSSHSAVTLQVCQRKLIHRKSTLVKANEGHRGVSLQVPKMPESADDEESADSDTSSELDFDREIPAPMHLTTAQERTRINMFG